MNGSDTSYGTFRAGTGYDSIVTSQDAGPSAGYAKLVIPEGFRVSDIEPLVAHLGISRARYDEVSGTS